MARTAPAPMGRPHGIPPYIWMSALGATATIGTGLGYAYYAFLDEVPLTKRRRWIATNPRWERQLGDQEYRKLKQQFKKAIVPDQHRAAVTVHRVGGRIAQAAKHFATENKLVHHPSATPYTYTVVRSDIANAFVLPNNHVFVMTGLFRYIQDEDELAAILGHEMAHNLARHAGERMSESLLTNLMARMSLLLDPSGTLFAFLIPTAALFRELPHSRIQEMEADQIGVHLAAQACYDPRAAKRVFQAMKDGTENSKGPPEFLSTHPSHDHRISNFEQWMPEAVANFQADGGLRCAKVRVDMRAARINAAHQATQREQSTLNTTAQ